MLLKATADFFAATCKKSQKNSMFILLALCTTKTLERVQRVPKDQVWLQKDVDLIFSQTMHLSYCKCMLVTKYYCLMWRMWWISGGIVGMYAPLLSVHFLSFSCRVLQKFCQIISWLPNLWIGSEPSVLNIIDSPLLWAFLPGNGTNLVPLTLTCLCATPAVHMSGVALCRPLRVPHGVTRDDLVGVVVLENIRLKLHQRKVVVVVI